MKKRCSNDDGVDFVHRWSYGILLWELFSLGEFSSCPLPELISVVSSSAKVTGDYCCDVSALTDK